MAIIVKHDNKLYIKEKAMADFSEPVMHYLHYPTDLRAREWPELVGLTCEYDRFFGGYHVKVGDRWRKILLPNGGQTSPEFTESEAVKPPGRGGKDWRWQWRWGKWEKVAK